jgi:Pentapeptide repeats (8 copies)
LEEENRPALDKIPRKEATLFDPVICADPEQAHVYLHTGNALDKTILSDANLVGAILYDAILSGAKLDKTVLSNARITEEQLKEATSLKGATMPDGTIHP